MKNIFITILHISLICSFAQAQAQTTNAGMVVMVNKGKMHIAANANPSDITAYVGGAVSAKDNSEIICNGEWKIQGSFFHDANTHVFEVDDLHKRTTSTGKVTFFGSSNGGKRFIAPQANRDLFQRAQYYAAFPNIVIDTGDTIAIPPKMGIDAITIQQKGASAGKLLLQSAAISSSVFDASLRITSSGNSAALVTKNSVIVEKWVESYRSGTGELFAYATPFDNTQMAGYFAGNYVRAPKRGTNDNVLYVMADKKASSTSTTIAGDQYVTWWNDILQPNQPYLLKLREKSYPYDDLTKDSQHPGGLGWTYDNNLSDYDVDKFVFNGKIFNAASNEEQLFARDDLYSYSVNYTPTAMQNWIIGNSYTSAISIDLLVKHMNACGIKFVDYIYLFPAGSTSYQGKSINSQSPVHLINVTEIPAMSIFMVRVKKGEASNGTFKVGKNMLVHSDVPNNIGDSYTPTPSSSAPSRMQAKTRTANSGSSWLHNQVVFTASDAENGNVFDLAAIGLREDADFGNNDSYDMAKIPGGDGFQLYTVYSDKLTSKVAANGVPLNTDSVLLYFNPTFKADSMLIKLSVEGKETLTSEDFWLEDLLLNATHNFEGDEPYYFTSYSSDAPERFVVHFKKNPKDVDIPDGIIINGEEKTDILMYNVKNQIFIENLLPLDLDANVDIFDIAGKLVDNFSINQYPKMTYPTKNLIKGMYIVRLQNAADRAKTLKMVIQ